MAFPPLAHSADLLVGSVLGAPGSTVSVQYNPSDPTHNSVDRNSNGIFGLIFIIPGLAMFCVALTGLIKLHRSNRDKRRATSAQMELIQNGFQELGDFWEPRHMTQAEANDVIADINQRLTIQRK